MPGYCNELNKIVEEYNYVVSYNPEFIAQGSIISDQQNPDQVLIGEGSNEAGDIIESIYSRLCHKTPVFCRMQPLSAEITKLATNCFLTTKIAFANAIGDLARSAGAEPEKVLNAIGADSRIGNKYFRYGFGYGGPCFPRDNRALGEFSKKAGYQLLIGEATDAANEAHAGFLSTQWMQENEAGKTIELDSVTYKPGTDILEESQQLKLALDLAKAGRKVHIHESAAVIAQLKNLFGNIFQYSENGY